MAGFSPACTALTTLIAEKPRNESLMYKTVDELLEAYPEWKIPADNNWDEKFWKDLMKSATPKGLKAKLCFQTDLLLTLVEAELSKLLVYRNIIKHILSVVEPKGNKKLILELTACLSGMPATFITGGGMTLATQRVIFLYEREGQVTCTKRVRRMPTKEELLVASKKSSMDMYGVDDMTASMLPFTAYSTYSSVNRAPPLASIFPNSLFSAEEQQVLQQQQQQLLGGLPQVSSSGSSFSLPMLLNPPPLPPAGMLYPGAPPDLTIPPLMSSSSPLGKLGSYSPVRRGNSEVALDSQFMIKSELLSSQYTTASFGFDSPSKIVSVTAAPFTAVAEMASGGIEGTEEDDIMKYGLILAGIRSN